eukprot:353518-Chlamydomonas_euryale.AAC.4
MVKGLDTANQAGPLASSFDQTTLCMLRWPTSLVSQHNKGAGGSAVTMHAARPARRGPDAARVRRHVAKL